ncbi:Nuclear pore complex protein [Panicum miliaceum]|uniref:Nuclear pore complex protein n=1 Tax=Panicum miliaceum TaxID=4540 RepID=A0A3L6S5H8_PANMI|nr:Nuclear pore complex protein [Panicum miliaceum]
METGDETKNQGGTIQLNKRRRVRTEVLLKSPSHPFPRYSILADAETAKAAKAKEVSLNLKSITQLYNDYAVPFNLWEAHP